MLVTIGAKGGKSLPNSFGNIKVIDKSCQKKEKKKKR